MHEARILQAANFLRSDNRREIIYLIRSRASEMAAGRGRGREDGQTYVSPLTGSSIFNPDDRTKNAEVKLRERLAHFPGKVLINGSRTYKAHLVPLREREITARFW